MRDIHSDIGDVVIKIGCVGTSCSSCPSNSICHTVNVLYSRVLINSLCIIDMVKEIIYLRIKQ